MKLKHALQICELDALTLRLELSDDKLVRNCHLYIHYFRQVHPVLEIDNNNNNANNQKTILTLCLKNYTGFTQIGSKHTTEYKHTSLIPNRFMYNIIRQNALVPALHVICPNAKYIHDKVRAGCYKVKFKKDFALTLPLLSSGNKMKSFQDDL